MSKKKPHPRELQARLASCFPSAPTLLPSVAVHLFLINFGSGGLQPKQSLVFGTTSETGGRIKSNSAAQSRGLGFSCNEMN